MSKFKCFTIYFLLAIAVGGVWSSDHDHDHREHDVKDVDSRRPVELTDTTFAGHTKSGVWLVEFFAPWCGFCQSLAPIWKSLAARVHGDPSFDGRVHIATLDATRHQSTARRYNIRGYPTIKLFVDGHESEDVYRGDRSLESLLDFVSAYKPEKKEPSVVRQLLSDKDLDDCRQAPLCVLAFLPPLRDCQAACRREYIALLVRETDAGGAADGRGWLVLWSEAGVHMALEQSLGLGPSIGYPSLAVVNGRRQKTAPMRGAFSDTGVRHFFKFIRYGMSSARDLNVSKMTVTPDVEPWDGRDSKEEPTVDVDDDIRTDVEDLEMVDL